MYTHMTEKEKYAILTVLSSEKTEELICINTIFFRYFSKA